MSSSNKCRKLSYITSIVFIFVVIFSSVTVLTTEEVYAAPSAFTQI
jgi:hypothetical protein